jgi:hypothetical protein
MKKSIFLSSRFWFIPMGILNSQIQNGSSKVEKNQTDTNYINNKSDWYLYSQWPQMEGLSPLEIIFKKSKGNKSVAKQERLYNDILK